MADEAVETELTEESGQSAAEEASSETTETEDAPLGPPGEKALEAFKARARDAEAEARGLAAKVQEYEDRDKSEQQKLAEQAEAARAEAEKAAAENRRLKVAMEKNLPAELVDRLRGDTLEELESDADQLLALVKPKAATDFDGGPRKAAKSPDRDELVRLMKDDPVEFNRRVDAGEIPADALA